LSIPAIWQKRRLVEVEGRVSKKRRIEVEEPRGKLKLIALRIRMEKEKLEVIEKMNAREKDNILDC
jgi:hypothetical protein